LLAARSEAAALLADARKAAVPLAVRMAERIVGHEVARDPAVLLDILAQAVRASGVAAGPVQMRIHPEDARLVEAQRPELAAKLGTSVLVRWVLDETIGRAGCIVETSKMRLDARLETQLDVLAQALLGGSPSARGGAS
jgi:type III secretion protein L